MENLEEMDDGRDAAECHNLIVASVLGITMAVIAVALYQFWPSLMRPYVALGMVLAGFFSPFFFSFVRETLREKRMGKK
ncbi:MAG: hypothetical protein Q8L10_05665 [Candidatus Moranbacteria bacterium]|nr:hypothetical protein [Candidatus Moranbacteria bacterium]